MTFKQLKEMIRELEFLNQGHIIDNYEVIVSKQYKKDRKISGVKIRKTNGGDQQKQRQIEIETDY